MNQFFTNTIKSRISCGEYPVGGRLHGVRTLAKEFGLTPGVVYRGLLNLAEEGLLASKHGRGFIVTGTRKVPVSVIKIAYFFSSSRLSRCCNMMTLKCAQDEILVNHFQLPDVLWNEKIIAAIDSGEYEAIVVEPHSDSVWIPAYSYALRRRFPLIFIDHQIVPNVFPVVGPNHFEFGFMAAGILKERGYRQVCYLGYEGSLNQGAELRLRGFQIGSEGWDAEIFYDLFKSPKHDQAEIRKTVIKHIEKHDVEVFLAGSSSFLGILGDIFAEYGIKAPDDFGLLGCNHVPPGMPMASCIAEQSDRESDVAIKILKKCLAGITLTENHSIFILPQFQDAGTLRRTEHILNNAYIGDVKCHL